MEDSNWYYVDGDRPTGPVDMAELHTRIEAGLLSGDDLVWQRGMEQWITVKDIYEPVPAPSSEPPVYPTNEPLQQESSYRETATNYPGSTAAPHKADPYNRAPQYENPYPDNKPKRRSFAFIFIALAFCASLVVLYFIISHNIEKKNQEFANTLNELERLGAEFSKFAEDYDEDRWKDLEQTLGFVDDSNEEYPADYDEHKAEAIRLAQESVNNNIEEYAENSANNNYDKRIIKRLLREDKRFYQQAIIDDGEDENKVYLKFVDAGGVTPSTLTTSRAFKYRQDLLVEVLVKMDKRDEIVNNRVKRFSDRLIEHGITSRKLEIYTEWYSQYFKMDVLIKSRESYRNVIVNSIAVLDLLEHNHENWTIDEQGTIQFIDSANELVYQYASLIADLHESKKMLISLSDQYDSTTVKELDEFLLDRY